MTGGQQQESRRGRGGVCHPGRASFVLGVATGGAAALTAWLAHRAEREYPPSGRFVDAQGVRLHVVDRGSGPAVVLLHGLRGSTRDFEHSIFEALAVRYRALAVDRPGYGYSQRPRKGGDSPLMQAELLHDALRQLGIERPIVVGHSMAAAVALAYAVKFPADTGAVVTLCGHVLPFDGFEAGPLTTLTTTPLLGRALAATVLAPLGMLVAPALLRLVFRPQRAPAGYARAATRLALRPRAFVASSEDRRSMDGGLLQIYKDYPGLRAPLVIVTGRADHVLSPAEGQSLHRLVPGSELIVLPDSGHMPHFADQQAVIAAIDRAAALAAG